VATSSEVRRLSAKWSTGSGWPKRLEWLEIDGLRGWTGQKFELKFPIMAIVGENGAGKSTVLQAAASVYRAHVSKDERFASDFFPSTTWDEVTDAKIRYAVKEGPNDRVDTIRKLTKRWLGNKERREREVRYIDLSRVQPVAGRLGYRTLANPKHKEAEATAFQTGRLARLTAIMGRKYEQARMALTNADDKREVPVVAYNGIAYSGYHQGAGETTIVDLIQEDLPKYGLVLIDEIESSLHPRAQHRAVRDLAARARELELQVVLTTHSPYVLEELPLEARACIIETAPGVREIVYGVSPEFAMTTMDDEQHFECDLYVEDEAAKIMRTEILVKSKPELVGRCQIIPFGAASTGKALGQMVTDDRFPRPSRVFLDGDQGQVPGCQNLPGTEAPERVIFEALATAEWAKLDQLTSREFAKVADACSKAMNLPDHHQWILDAASPLALGGNDLWRAMCAAWAAECLSQEDADAIAQIVEDALIGLAPPTSPPALAPEPPSPNSTGADEPEPEPAPPLTAKAPSGKVEHQEPTATAPIAGAPAPTLFDSLEAPIADAD
jgi:predicted ATPase